MRLISSKWTSFHKKIVPDCIFVTGVVTPVLVLTLAYLAPDQGYSLYVNILLLALLVSTLIVSYREKKVFAGDLLDEVWDDGENLVLVNDDQRVTVPLSHIINVSETFGVPWRITLLLRPPCRFGGAVVFAPPLRRDPVFKPTARGSVVGEDLLKRVHRLEEDGQK